MYSQLYVLCYICTIVIFDARLVTSFRQIFYSTDIWENNVGNVPEGTWRNCCTWCSERSSCVAFSWNSHNGGTCWLKSANSDHLRRPKNGVTSGSCSLLNNRDIPGNEHSHKLGQPRDCWDHCVRYAGCMSFAWNRHNGGTCWFKKTSCGAVYTSGVKLQIVRPCVNPPPPGPRPDDHGLFPLPSPKSWVPTFKLDGKFACAPDYARNDRNGKCLQTLDHNVPVYYHTSFCDGNKYYRIQYWLFYGWQHACFGPFGEHDNDWEHVQLNFKRCNDNGKYCIKSILFSQHKGWYTRHYERPDTNPVNIDVYIGKKSHGMYWRSCCARGCDHGCLGNCGYYQDFRNPKSSTIWRPHNVVPVSTAEAVGGTVGNRIKGHWRKAAICENVNCKSSGCQQNDGNLQS